MKIDSGFLSPYFARDSEGGEVIEFEENGNVYVATILGTVETEKDIIKLLEFTKKVRRPLIIFAEDFSSEALTSLVVNKLQLGLKICAVKVPMLMASEVIEDIAVFSNSQLVGDAYSLHPAMYKTDPINYVGKVKGATISSKDCVLKGFKDDVVTN